MDDEKDAIIGSDGEVATVIPGETVAEAAERAAPEPVPITPALPPPTLDANVEENGKDIDDPAPSVVQNAPPMHGENGPIKKRSVYDSVGFWELPTVEDIRGWE